MTTTAAAVAAVLASSGVDRVFGLPGGEVLVLIDELRKAGIDFVLMRHEANAGLAAGVYGKLRGQAGVALTTLGPGAANLMLPLCNAELDHEPLLALSAQIPSHFPETHTHQRLPLIDMFAPVCKCAGTITPQTVFDLVPTALASCLQRPYGPAFLTLSARDAVKAAEGERTAIERGQEQEADDRDAASRDAASTLASLLAEARRPIVLVGLGVDPANGDRLREWVTRWDLPVAVTPKMKGIVDETSTGFVGVIGGMAADTLMDQALHTADLRIGFGLDPVEIDKTWHAELPIHWVLESPNATGVVPDGADLVSHARVLDALLDMAAPGRHDAPFRSVQERRLRLLEGQASTRDTMWPGDVVRALAEALPESTMVTTDVGTHKFLFGQFWPSREPGTFWMSNGLSGMGYGLSAAIGASLARPGVPVLAVVGDGGFSMNCQELETAVRVGAPFVTLVLEDGSYSLIKLAQEGRQLEPYRMDFDRIDTVKIAEACGIEGLRTTDPAELGQTARRAVTDRRHVVLAVPIDYRDYRHFL